MVKRQPPAGCCIERHSGTHRSSGFGRRQLHTWALDLAPAGLRSLAGLHTPRRAQHTAWRLIVRQLQLLQQSGQRRTVQPQLGNERIDHYLTLTSIVNDGSLAAPSPTSRSDRPRGRHPPECGARQAEAHTSRSRRAKTGVRWGGQGQGGVACGSSTGTWRPTPRALAGLKGYTTNLTNLHRSTSSTSTTSCGTSKRASACPNTIYRPGRSTTTSVNESRRT